MNDPHANRTAEIERLILSRQVSLFVAGSALIVCLAFGFGLHLGPSDDAYITFRHAQNFANGDGLVFNPGEKVEATTNFLFAIVLGCLAFVGISPIYGSLIVNGLSIFFTFYLLLEQTRRRENRLPLLLRYRLSGSLFYVLCPSTVFYLFHGLETPFFTTLLLAGCVMLLKRNEESDDKWLLFSGLMFGLAACTRMEAALYIPAALLLVLTVIRIDRRIKSALWLLIGFSLVFVPVLVTRGLYYGDFLPNTYYAKMHGGGSALCLRGLKQTRYFLTANLGAALVLVFGVWGIFERKVPLVRTAILIGCIAIQFSIVIAAGGDYFPYFRFIVPAIPMIALLFQDLVTTPKMPSHQDENSGRTSSTLRISFVSILAISLINGIFATTAPSQGESAHLEHRRALQRIKTGMKLRDNLPKDATLLLIPVGAIPYFSGLRAHDFYGLTDPEVAKISKSLGRGIPGHEKTDPIRQIKRLKPDVISVFSCKRKAKAFNTDDQRTLSYYVARILSVPSPQGTNILTYHLIKRSFLPRLGPDFKPIPKNLHSQVKSSSQNIPCLVL